MVPSIKNQLKIPKFKEQTLNKSAGILDDYAVRKNVATREGTIEKVPVNDNDIVNKLYVDSFVSPHTESSTDSLTNKTMDDFSNKIDADEIHIRIRNESGSTMMKGQLVYISGYNVGLDRTLVTLADASSSATMPMLAMINDRDIPNNSSGHATVYGRVFDIDTSAFAVGDAVYVSTTAGEFSTRPSGVNDQVQRIGIVLRSQVNNGVIQLIGAGRVNDIPNNIDHDTDIINVSPDDHHAEVHTHTHTSTTGRTADDHHNKRHALQDTLAHFGSANSVWYTQNNGNVIAVPLVADGSFLGSNGVTSAPSWKLETSINHNTLTNTHNLTTDIDHDLLLNFESSEHLDWSVSGVGTIHADNYVDNDTTDHTSFSNIGTNTHVQLDSHLALVNEHIDWTNATNDFLTAGSIKATTTTGATLLNITGTGAFIGMQVTSNIASPNAFLDFRGQADALLARFQLSSNNLSIQNRTATGNMSFSTNGIIRMTIASGGALDLVGDFTAGTIKADDGFTGSFTAGSGETVTVVGGIITSVA